ncbi:MAG TPA: M28 family peptidase [Gemmatimonadaceae bacterium]|nr:M28 family peptidase [Gemmatimonadaceae bacterium]
MHTILRPLLASLLVLPAPALAQHPPVAELPRKHTPEPTTADITVRDLMTRTYIIADDSMEGRDTGRRGGVRSANYIARELARLGLEPAGDNGTFLQAIPWISRTPDSTSTLQIGATSLHWGTDFLLLPKLGFALALGGQPFGGGFRGENVASVYGGRIGGATIAPAEVRGKVVVFGTEATSASFTFWQRDNLRRYADAKAIVVATLDIGAPAAYRATRETYWDSAATGAARPLTVITMTNAAAEHFFARPLASLAVGTIGVTMSGRVTFIDTPTEAPAYNVVGILRGTDARLRNSYVAVGAHHDHVGFSRPVDHDSIRAFNSVARQRGADDRPRQATTEETARIKAILDSLHAAHPARLDSINNGADDDGSGSVLELEIAESFARSAQRPKRSLLFVWHTAEEKGLYGAQYFSDHPTVPRDSIIAQVNMDQMGRGDPIDNPRGGSNSLVLIGSRRLSTELGDLAERVNKKPEYAFTLDYTFDADGDPTNGYCRSDHYMYARYGIPVVFYSAAAWHIDYHMVSDEPQYIAYDRMTRIGKYIRDVIGSIANLDHRPVVDKPKPDPDGVCRQ